MQNFVIFIQSVENLVGTIEGNPNKIGLMVETIPPSPGGGVTSVVDHVPFAHQKLLSCQVILEDTVV